MNYTREDVVKALGLESVENPEQDQVIGMFLINLDQRVQAAVMEELTDEKLEDFNKAIEKGDGAAETWLSANVPGFDEIEGREYHKLIAEANAAGEDFLKTSKEV